MTTITLTPEQIEGIVKAAKAEHAKAYAALQKRTDARVARADARTADWKHQYSEARKSLIQARAEVNELKRRLRNGELE